MGFLRFVTQSLRVALTGGKYYYVWLAFLAVLIAIGVVCTIDQLRIGLIATNMRDQVSWGFYIGNFTFLVGVAAAAVLLVIPAYVYRWKPIMEVAVLGEILAISALIMAILFVALDIGQPVRMWHLIPVLGTLNWPSSMLAWDTLVLNLYLALNLFVVTYILYSTYRGRHYNKGLVYVLVLISVPAAISIHTVTAFLYNGLGARPFWNASILAPKFLASAFCSGPAILVIVFQLLQRTTRFEIKNEAIWKVAELMAYAMFINLFLTGAEVFKEFYSDTQHAVYSRYLWFGLHGHDPLVPYAWSALACSFFAFLLLLIPATRKHPVTLNLGCLLIYTGVYIEKGMGLVVPGFTPDTLGEIYEYVPSWTEVGIGAGVFAVGFLMFTFMVRIAIAIMLGDFRADGSSAPAHAEDTMPASTAPATGGAG